MRHVAVAEQLDSNFPALILCELSPLRYHLLTLLMILAPLCASEAIAAEPPAARELVLTDQPYVQASLRELALADSQLLLTDAQNEPIDTGFKQLVRWGNPSPVVENVQVLLADGSIVVPSNGWSPTGKVQVTESEVVIYCRRKSIRVPRQSVRNICFQSQQKLPSDLPLLEEDLVTLIDGDQLQGKVVELNAKQLKLELYGQLTELPIERIANLQLATADLQASIERPEAACLVGLSDGSLFKAVDLKIADGIYQLKTVGGAALKGQTTDVVYVQPLRQESFSYLSDRQVIGYRHTPYMSLEWPYGIDELPRGGQLKTGGRWYGKGIGMHTASRLVYALEASDKRFQASIAIADAPVDVTATNGSVLFRVLLVEAEGIRPLYESPLVRAGNAPISIDLDIQDARALILLVDYADRADVGDNALWLDARLVR